MVLLQPTLQCANMPTSSPCGKAILHAMTHGFAQNPEHYIGLSVHSTYSAFQAYYHNGDMHFCPRPCLKMEQACVPFTPSFPGMNHIAECRKQMVQQPEAFPELSSDSTDQEVAKALYMRGAPGVPRVCEDNEVAGHAVDLQEEEENEAQSEVSGVKKAVQEIYIQEEREREEREERAREEARRRREEARKKAEEAWRKQQEAIEKAQEEARRKKEQALEKAQAARRNASQAPAQDNITHKAEAARSNASHAHSKANISKAEPARSASHGHAQAVPAQISTTTKEPVEAGGSASQGFADDVYGDSGSPGWDGDGVDGDGDSADGDDGAWDTGYEQYGGNRDLLDKMEPGRHCFTSGRSFSLLDSASHLPVSSRDSRSCKVHCRSSGEAAFFVFQVSAGLCHCPPASARVVEAGADFVGGHLGCDDGSAVITRDYATVPAVSSSGKHVALVLAACGTCALVLALAAFVNRGRLANPLLYPRSALEGCDCPADYGPVHEMRTVPNFHAASEVSVPFAYEYV